MASLGDGNSWRGQGEAVVPWERDEEGTLFGPGAEVREQPLPEKPVSEKALGFNQFVKPAQRRVRRLCPMTTQYCPHNPPCPPTSLRG